MNTKPSVIEISATVLTPQVAFNEGARTLSAASSIRSAPQIRQELADEGVRAPLYCLAPQIISLAFAAPVQFQAVISRNRPRLSSLFPDYRGELWESLSYGALWLSGLLGVGLCFV